MAAVRTRALGWVAVAWLAALAVNRSLQRVRGHSMSPTLEPGMLLLTLPVARPRRGEVVVVLDPRDRGRRQVKRVAGLPGDVVDSTIGTIEVPPRHVAVLGDNHAASTDSRTYGPVPLELVLRRAPLALTPRPRRLRRRG